jgi:hypothetical protein
MEYFRGLLRPHMTPPPQAPRSEPIRAETLARMADGVYDRGGDRPQDIDGFKPMSEKALREKGIDPALLHTPSGMHAEVYRDERDGRTVLSFRGTDNPKVDVVTRPFDGPTGLDPEIDMMNALRGSEQSLRVTGVGQSGRDWMTNFRQGLGYETQQHSDTVALAKQCDVAFGDKLVFTGHSKGGGQAELASVVVDKPAMTFNPAGVHEETMRRFGVDPERGRGLAQERITSVVTKGEAVDFIQGREFMGLKTPVPLGQRVDIVPDESLGKVARHLMTPGVLPYLDQLQGRQIELPRQAPSETPSLFRPSMFGHGGLGMSGMSDAFRFPLHGGLGQTWLQMQQEAQVPNLSKEAHPRHGLYQQALERVEALGETGRDAARISGALTVAAQTSGMRGIDHVVASRDGSTYFATQGDPSSLFALRAPVDVEQAKQTPLSQSSRESMDLFRQQAPAQEAVAQQRAFQRE